METFTIDQLKEAIGEVLDKKGFTTLLNDVSSLKDDVSSLKDDVNSLKGKVDGLEIKFDGISSSVTEALDLLAGLSIKVSSLDTTSEYHSNNITVLNQNFQDIDSKIEKFEGRILLLEDKIEQIENQQKTE